MSSDSKYIGIDPAREGGDKMGKYVFRIGSVSSSKSEQQTCRRCGCISVRPLCPACERNLSTDQITDSDL